ncbi:Ankyrin repeat-containing domain protein [Rhypophila decipiens]
MTAADKFGNTALHLAVSTGHARIATLLIKRGSDNHARNKLEDTPLHIACREGFLNVAKICIEAIRKEHIPAGRNEGQSGSANGATSRTAGLGAVKAALKTRNMSGSSPFHLAAQAGHDNMLAHLVDPLNLGVDDEGQIPIDLPNGLGLTALHLAAENNHAEVCKVLLGLGASIIALSVAGDTPVSLAKKNKNAETVAVFEEYLKSPAGRSEAGFFTDA